MATAFFRFKIQAVDKALNRSPGTTLNEIIRWVSWL